MNAPPPANGPNRRVVPRKAFRQGATLVHGDTTKRVQTWDLGRDGMCLLASRSIAPGTRCKITFDVPLGADVVSVTAAAKIVYSSYSAAGEFKIGAVFTDLEEGVALLLGKFAATA